MEHEELSLKIEKLEQKSNNFDLRFYGIKQFILIKRY